MCNPGLLSSLPCCAWLASCYRAQTLCSRKEPGCSVTLLGLYWGGPRCHFCVLPLQNPADKTILVWEPPGQAWLGKARRRAAGSSKGSSCSLFLLSAQVFCHPAPSPRTATRCPALFASAVAVLGAPGAGRFLFHTSSCWQQQRNLCGQGLRLGAEAGLRVPPACSPRELQRAIATSWGLGELHFPAQQIVLRPRNASNDPSEPAPAAHTLRQEAAAWFWSPAVRSAAMPFLPLAASASGQCARGFLQCPLTLGRHQVPQHSSVRTPRAVPMSSTQLCSPRAGFRWVTARGRGPAEHRVRGVNAPGGSTFAGGGCRVVAALF